MESEVAGGRKDGEKGKEERSCKRKRTVKRKRKVEEGVDGDGIKESGDEWTEAAEVQRKTRNLEESRELNFIS